MGSRDHDQRLMRKANAAQKLRRLLGLGPAAASPRRAKASVLQAEPLEPRVLLSAEALVIPPSTLTLAPALVTNFEVPQSLGNTLSTHASATQQAREIVFIDPQVEEAQDLLRTALADRTDAQAEVVVLDATSDGLEQMSRWLSTRRDIQTVHIISHGTEGNLLLGNAVINRSALLARSSELNAWRDALTDSADILLYGCDLSGHAAGQSFVDTLAHLTGADIASSVDATGDSAAGGNWQLENATGPIDSQTLRSLGYAHVLTLDASTLPLNAAASTRIQSAVTMADAIVSAALSDAALNNDLPALGLSVNEWMGLDTDTTGGVTPLLSGMSTASQAYFTANPTSSTLTGLASVLQTTLQTQLAANGKGATWAVSVTPTLSFDTQEVVANLRVQMTLAGWTPASANVTAVGGTSWVGALAVTSQVNIDYDIGLTLQGVTTSTTASAAQTLAVTDDGTWLHLRQLSVQLDASGATATGAAPLRIKAGIDASMAASLQLGDAQRLSLSQFNALGANNTARAGASITTQAVATLNGSNGTMGLFGAWSANALSVQTFTDLNLTSTQASNLAAVFSGAAKLGTQANALAALGKQLPLADTTVAGLLTMADGRTLGDVLSFATPSNSNVLTDYLASTTAPRLSGLLDWLQQYFSGTGVYGNLEALMPAYAAAAVINIGQTGLNGSTGKLDLQLRLSRLFNSRFAFGDKLKSLGLDWLPGQGVPLEADIQYDTTWTFDASSTANYTLNNLTVQVKRPDNALDARVTLGALDARAVGQVVFETTPITIALVGNSTTVAAGSLQSQSQINSSNAAAQLQVTSSDTLKAAADFDIVGQLQGVSFQSLVNDRVSRTEANGLVISATSPSAVVASSLSVEAPTVDTQTLLYATPGPVPTASLPTLTGLVSRQQSSSLQVTVSATSPLAALTRTYVLGTTASTILSYDSTTQRWSLNLSQDNSLSTGLAVGTYSVVVSAAAQPHVSISVGAGNSAQTVATPLAWSLVDSTTPTLATAGFDVLRKFANIDAVTLTNMLRDVASYLAALRDSGQFDAALPLTQVQLGSALDFSAAFQDIVRSELMQSLGATASGAAAISPVLIKDLAFDIQFKRPQDARNSLLTITVLASETSSFTHIRQLAELLDQKIATAYAGALAYLLGDGTIPASPIASIHEAVQGGLGLGTGRSNEVQNVDLYASAGTFRLKLGNGLATTALSVHASPTEVQLALESLPGIGKGNVVVTGSPKHFAVEFVGELGQMNVDALSVTFGANASRGGALDVFATNLSVGSDGKMWGVLNFRESVANSFSVLKVSPTAGVVVSSVTAGSSTADTVQRVMVMFPAFVAGNQFTLNGKFGSQSYSATVSLAAAANGADTLSSRIQAALNAAINTAAGTTAAPKTYVTVTASGSAVTVSPGIQSFEVVFDRTLFSGADVDLLTANTSSMLCSPGTQTLSFVTQAAASAVAASPAQGESQRMVLSNVSGGQFSFGYSSNGKSYESDPITVDTSNVSQMAQAIQSALFSLMQQATPGLVDTNAVQVQGSFDATSSTLYFDVGFVTQLAGRDMPQLIINPVPLTLPAATHSYGDVTGIGFSAGGADSQQSAVTSFVTLQELMARFQQAVNQQLSGVRFDINPRFDNATQSFLFDLKLMPAAQVVSTALKVDSQLGSLSGVDVASSLDLSLQPYFQTTLGFDFSQLNTFALAAKGSVKGSVTGTADLAASPTPTSPITWTLTLGKDSYNLSVAAGTYTRDTLKTAVNTAMQASTVVANGDLAKRGYTNVGQAVVASLTGNKLTFTVQASVPTFKVGAQTQLGFANELSGATALTPVTLASNGRLTADAHLLISIDGIPNMAVTVLKSATDANSSVADLVADINAALTNTSVAANAYLGTRLGFANLGQILQIYAVNDGLSFITRTPKVGSVAISVASERDSATQELGFSDGQLAKTSGADVFLMNAAMGGQWSARVYQQTSASNRVSLAKPGSASVGLLDLQFSNVGANLQGALSFELRKDATQNATTNNDVRLSLNSDLFDAVTSQVGQLGMSGDVSTSSSQVLGAVALNANGQLAHDIGLKLVLKGANADGSDYAADVVIAATSTQSFTSLDQLADALDAAFHTALGTLAYTGTGEAAASGTGSQTTHVGSHKLVGVYRDVSTSTPSTTQYYLQFFAPTVNRTVGGQSSPTPVQLQLSERLLAARTLTNKVFTDTLSSANAPSAELNLGGMSLTLPSSLSAQGQVNAQASLNVTVTNVAALLNGAQANTTVTVIPTGGLGALEPLTQVNWSDVRSELATLPELIGNLAEMGHYGELGQLLPGLGVRLSDAFKLSSTLSSAQAAMEALSGNPITTFLASDASKSTAVKVTADTNFTLSVNGETPIAVTLTASSTTTNTTRQDLVDDIQAALNAVALADGSSLKQLGFAKLGDAVTVGIDQTTGLLKLVMRADVDSATLASSASSKWVTELGFAASATLAPTQTRVSVATLQQVLGNAFGALPNQIELSLDSAGQALKLRVPLTINIDKDVSLSLLLDDNFKSLLSTVQRQELENLLGTLTQLTDSKGTAPLRLTGALNLVLEFGIDMKPGGTLGHVFLYDHVGNGTATLLDDAGVSLTLHAAVSATGLAFDQQQGFATLRVNGGQFALQADAAVTLDSGTKGQANRLYLTDAQSSIDVLGSSTATLTQRLGAESLFKSAFDVVFSGSVSTELPISWVPDDQLGQLLDIERNNPDTKLDTAKLSQYSNPMDLGSLKFNVTLDKAYRAIAGSTLHVDMPTTVYPASQLQLSYGDRSLLLSIASSQDTTGLVTDDQICSGVAEAVYRLLKGSGATPLTGTLSDAQNDELNLVKVTGGRAAGVSVTLSGALKTAHTGTLTAQLTRDNAVLANFSSSQVNGALTLPAITLPSQIDTAASVVLKVLNTSNNVLSQTTTTLSSSDGNFGLTSDANVQSALALATLKTLTTSASGFTSRMQGIVMPSTVDTIAFSYPGKAAQKVVVPKAEDLGSGTAMTLAQSNIAKAISTLLTGSDSSANLVAVQFTVTGSSVKSATMGITLSGALASDYNDALVITTPGHRYERAQQVIVTGTRADGFDIRLSSDLISFLGTATLKASVTELARNAAVTQTAQGTANALTLAAVGTNAQYWVLSGPQQSSQIIGLSGATESSGLASDAQIRTALRDAVSTALTGSVREGQKTTGATITVAGTRTTGFTVTLSGTMAGLGSGLKLQAYGFTAGASNDFVKDAYTSLVTAVGQSVRTPSSAPTGSSTSGNPGSPTDSQVETGLMVVNTDPYSTATGGEGQSTAAYTQPIAPAGSGSTTTSGSGMDLAYIVPDFQSWQIFVAQAVQSLAGANPDPTKVVSYPAIFLLRDPTTIINAISGLLDKIDSDLKSKLPYNTPILGTNITEAFNFIEKVKNGFNDTVKEWTENAVDVYGGLDNWARMMLYKLLTQSSFNSDWAITSAEMSDPNYKPWLNFIKDYNNDTKITPDDIVVEYIVNKNPNGMNQDGEYVGTSRLNVPPGMLPLEYDAGQRAAWVTSGMNAPLASLSGSGLSYSLDVIDPGFGSYQLGFDITVNGEATVAQTLSINRDASAQTVAQQILLALNSAAALLNDPTLNLVTGVNVSTPTTTTVDGNTVRHYTLTFTGPSGAALPGNLTLARTDYTTGGGRIVLDKSVTDWMAANAAIQTGSTYNPISALQDILQDTSAIQFRMDLGQTYTFDIASEFDVGIDNFPLYVKGNVGIGIDLNWDMFLGFGFELLDKKPYVVANMADHAGIGMATVVNANGIAIGTQALATDHHFGNLFAVGKSDRQLLEEGYTTTLMEQPTINYYKSIEQREVSVSFDVYLVGDNNKPFELEIEFLFLNGKIRDDWSGYLIDNAGSFWGNVSSVAPYGLDTSKVYKIEGNDYSYTNGQWRSGSLVFTPDAFVFARDVAGQLLTVDDSINSTVTGGELISYRRTNGSPFQPSVSTLDPRLFNNLTGAQGSRTHLFGYAELDITTTFTDGRKVLLRDSPFEAELKKDLADLKKEKAAVNKANKTDKTLSDAEKKSRLDAADKKVKEGEGLISDYNKSTRLDAFMITVGIKAQINLIAELGVGLDGKGFLPSIPAGIHVYWGMEKTWNKPTGKTGDVDIILGALSPKYDRLFTETPTVWMTDIGLNMGTFISNFVRPIFGTIGDVIKPIKPVIDALNTPIPGLSDIMGRPYSVLDLASTFSKVSGGVAKLDYVIALVRLADTINKINQFQNGTAGVVLPIISVLKLSGKEIQQMNFSKNMLTMSGGGAVTTAVSQGIQAFNQALQQPGNALRFPILEDKVTFAINMLLGIPMDLVTFNPPKLEVSVGFRVSFPIFPPLYVGIGGEIKLQANLTLGFDTYGIMKARKTGNWLDAFDGFYVSDNIVNGVDIPEVILTTKLYAFAELNVFIVKGGVEGGVKLVGTLDLCDPDNSDNTGKIRASELISAIANDPLGLVVMNLRGSAYISAYVDVFALFGYVRVWEKTFMDVTLFQWEYNPCDKQPVLGVIDGTVLVLNAGSGEAAIDGNPAITKTAADRQRRDTTDGDESFTLRQTGGGIEIEARLPNRQTYKQTFSNVTSVRGAAGKGNDTLDARALSIPVYFVAGEGADTLYGGSGNDILVGSTSGNARLEGGGGNDKLIARGGNTVMLGGNGDDTYRFLGNWGQATLMDGATTDTVGTNILDFSAQSQAITIDDWAYQALSGSRKVQWSYNTAIDLIQGSSSAGDRIDLSGNTSNLLVDVTATNAGWVMGGGTGRAQSGLTASAAQVTASQNAGRGFRFQGFENVIGGQGSDVFYMLSGASVSGSLIGTTQGGLHDTAEVTGVRNTIDFSSYTDSVALDLEQNSSFGTAKYTGIVVRGFHNIFGGSGNDTLIGDSRNNLIVGNGGADTIDGRAGHDLLVADQFYTWVNQSTRQTVAVADYMKLQTVGVASQFGDLGRRWLWLGQTLENISLTTASQTLRGGSGNDIILGALGSDLINTGGTAQDDDTIIADLGRLAVDFTYRSALWAESTSASGGNDTIYLGSSNNLVIAGAGSDQVVGSDVQGNMNIVLADNGRVDFKTNVINGRLTFKSNGTSNHMLDSITSTVAEVQGGNDVVTLGSGSGIVIGGAGNDLLSFSALSSTAANVRWIAGDHATISTDSLGSVIAFTSSDTQASTGGDDVIGVGSANDSALRYLGSNYIIGGMGNDRVLVSASRSSAGVMSYGAAYSQDVILGDNGSITRPSGSVYLAQVVSTQVTAGLGGADEIYTANGNKVIVGGQGSDTLTVAAGATSASLSASTRLIAGDNAQFVFDTWGRYTLATTLDSSVSTGGSDTVRIGTASTSGNIGANVVFGGMGADQIMLASNYASSTVTLSSAQSQDILFGDNGEITRTTPANSATPNYLVRIRTIENTSGAADMILAANGEKVIMGGLNNDVIQAGNGDNLIMGDNAQIEYEPTQFSGTPTPLLNQSVSWAESSDDGIGNDTITVGTGSNLIIAGAGTDQVTANDPQPSTNVVLGDNGRVTFKLAGTGSHPAFQTNSTGRYMLDAITTAVTEPNGNNDTISLRSGSGIVIGGAGADRVSFDALSATSSNIRWIAGDHATVTTDSVGSIINFASSDSLSSTGDIDEVSIGSDADSSARDLGYNYIIAGMASDRVLVSSSRSNTGVITYGAAYSQDVILGDNGSISRWSDSIYLSQVLSTQVTAGLGDADEIYTANGNKVIVGGVDADTVRVQTTASSTTLSASTRLIAGDNAQFVFDTWGRFVLAKTIDTQIATGNGDTVYIGTDSTVGDMGSNVVFGGMGADQMLVGATYLNGIDRLGTVQSQDILIGDNGEITRTASTNTVPNYLKQIVTTQNDKGDADQILSANGNKVILGGFGGDVIHAADGDNLVMGDNAQIDYDTLSLNGMLRQVQSTEIVVGGNDTITLEEGYKLVAGGYGRDQINILANQVGNLGTAFTSQSRGQATWNGSLYSVTSVVGVPNVADSGNAGRTGRWIAGDNAQFLFDDQGGLITMRSRDDISATGGDDVISLGAADADVTTNLGLQVVIGGMGNDTISSRELSLSQDVFWGDNAELQRRARGYAWLSMTSTVTLSGGNDTVSTGRGNKILVGGYGADSLTARTRDLPPGASQTDNRAIVMGDAGTIGFDLSGQGALKRIESIALSTGGDDTVSLGDGDVTFIGGYGRDALAVDSVRSAMRIAAGDNALLTFAGDPNVMTQAKDIVLVQTLDLTTTTGDADRIRIGAAGSAQGEMGVALVLGGIGADNLSIQGASADSVVLGDNGQISVLQTPALTLPNGQVAIQWLNGQPIAGASGVQTSYIDSVASLTPELGAGDTIKTLPGQQVVIAGQGADTVTAGSGSSVIFGDSARLSYASGVLRQALSISQAQGGADRITVGTGSTNIDGHRILVGGFGADDINITAVLGSSVALNALRERFVAGDNASINLDAAGRIIQSSTLDTDNATGGDDTILLSVNGTAAGITDLNITAGGVGNDTVIVNSAAPYSGIASGDGLELRRSDGTQAPAAQYQTLYVAVNQPFLGGNDVMRQGSGNMIIFGGAGADRIDTSTGSTDTSIVFGDAGQASFDALATGQLVQISSLAESSGGTDAVSLGQGRIYLMGGAGSDDLAMAGGDNNTRYVWGDTGQLTFQAGQPDLMQSGTNSLDAAKSADTLGLPSSADIVNGNTTQLQGANFVLGGPGTDVLAGQPSSNDRVLPGAGMIDVSNLSVISVTVLGNPGEMGMRIAADGSAVPGYTWGKVGGLELVQRDSAGTGGGGSSSGGSNGSGSGGAGAGTGTGGAGSSFTYVLTGYGVVQDGITNSVSGRVSYPSQTYGLATFAPTTLQGVYGQLSLVQDGSWTYSLPSGPSDTTAAAQIARLQALSSNDVRQETFRIVTTDGSTTVVNIDVRGNPLDVFNATGQVTEAGGVHNAVAGSPSVSGNLLGSAIGVANNTQVVGLQQGSNALALGSDVSTAHGTLRVNAQGDFTYQLDDNRPAVEGLAQGERVSETFTYSVLRDGGRTDSAILTISIDGRNDVPDLTAVTVSALQAEPTDNTPIALSGQVLFTDVDLSDRPQASFRLTAVAATQSGGQALVLSTAQQQALTAGFGLQTPNSNTHNGAVNWTFTRSANDVRFLRAGDQVQLTYDITVDDGQGGLRLQAVTITLTGSNQAPVLAGQNTADIQVDLATSAQGQLTVADPDRGEAAYVAQSYAGQWGRLDVQANGTWTYALATPERIPVGSTQVDNISVVSQDAQQAAIQMSITVRGRPLSTLTGGVGGSGSTSGGSTGSGGSTSGSGGAGSSALNGDSTSSQGGSAGGANRSGTSGTSGTSGLIGSGTGGSGAAGSTSSQLGSQGSSMTSGALTKPLTEPQLSGDSLGVSTTPSTVPTYSPLTLGSQAAAANIQVTQRVSAMAGSDQVMRINLSDISQAVTLSRQAVVVDAGQTPALAAPTSAPAPAPAPEAAPAPAPTSSRPEGAPAGDAFVSQPDAPVDEANLGTAGRDAAQTESPAAAAASVEDGDIAQYGSELTATAMGLGALVSARHSRIDWQSRGKPVDPNRPSRKIHW